MALSLLQICTRALDRIGSLNVPTFFIGNDDDLAKQVVAIAREVGEELSRDYDWQELIQTATVTTTDGGTLYDLPADYERMAPDTMWETNGSRNMRGSTTKRQWSAITNVPGSNDDRYRWRLKGSQIEVYPAPPVLEFNYEYLSRFYCRDAGGVALEEWGNDTDVPRLRHDLFVAGIRYYISEAKGLATGGAEAVYDAIISKRQSADEPPEAICMTDAVVPLNNRFPYYLNIPDVVDYS